MRDKKIKPLTEIARISGSKKTTTIIIKHKRSDVKTAYQMIRRMSPDELAEYLAGFLSWTKKEKALLIENIKTMLKSEVISRDRL